MIGVSKVVYIDKIVCSNKVYYLNKKVLLEIIDMKQSFEWVCSRYNLQGSAQTEEEAINKFFEVAGNKIDMIRSEVSTRLSQDVYCIEKREED